MTQQDFHTYQEQIFDSYCKRLFRNESADAKKELARRSKREIPFSSMPYGELASLAHLDTYHLEGITLPVGKDAVAVNDLILGQAILALPPQLRDVILLSYFLERNDVQIGQIQAVTPQAIRYRKRKALDRLKEMLEVLGYEW